MLKSELQARTCCKLRTEDCYRLQDVLQVTGGSVSNRLLSVPRNRSLLVTGNKSLPVTCNRFQL